MPSSATKAGAGTTSSASWVSSLSDGGATSVTLNTGSTVLVILTGLVNAGKSNHVAYMSFAISGDTTRAASEATALSNQDDPDSTGAIQASAVYIVTGLTPGSNTFTLNYRVTNAAAPAATFSDRSIIVIPF
jgi:hypothetical protein